jgi:hypothetical protein
MWEHASRVRRKGGILLHLALGAVLLSPLGALPSRSPDAPSERHAAAVRGNEAFHRTFTLVAEYVLEKKEGAIQQLIVDRNGFLWVRDWEAIEKYDRGGKLVKVIGGKGGSPGRFLLLTGLAVDEDGGRVFAVDLQQQRVHLFAQDGRLLQSWIVARPGYMPQEIVLDKTRGLYYMGGSLPQKTRISEGSLHVHKYKLETNAYMGSFLETDQADRSVREKNLFNYLYVSSLDVDSAGNVYCTLAPVYKIFKINPRRRTIQAFRGRHRFYKAPPAYPRSGAKPEELRKLRKAWTQVDRVVVVRGRFAVLSLELHEPFPYGLEVFDVNGRLLRSDILTDGRLVGRDREGNLYFAVVREGKHVVAAYSLTLDDRARPLRKRQSS